MIQFLVYFDILVIYSPLIFILWKYDILLFSEQYFNDNIDVSFKRVNVVKQHWNFTPHCERCVALDNVLYKTTLHYYSYN